MLMMAGMAHGQKHDHDGGHGHFQHGKHGNPEDLAEYIAKMEAPDRAEWQKPDEVLKALALKEGQVACDIGAGPGYFSLRLMRAVGERGQVFAVDVEPRILEVLKERVIAQGLRNVTPVLALDDDPLLPRAACDLILIVDTFHHLQGHSAPPSFGGVPVPDGAAYLKRLELSLKPGGRIANIDFHKRETPIGPPVEHRVSREDFLKSAQAAGLAVVDEPTFLPHQYFVILKPR